MNRKKRKQSRQNSWHWKQSLVKTEKQVELEELDIKIKSKKGIIQTLIANKFKKGSIERKEKELQSLINERNELLRS